MTLGNAAAARVRFIVWCTECWYQTEPDPAEMAERYDPETPMIVGDRSAGASHQPDEFLAVDEDCRTNCGR
jgi:hypothetical protein